jgi:hypothetical protein
MESRVTRRKPQTIEQTGGKTGRRNIRPTDEEACLRAGLYSDETEEVEEEKDEETKDEW